MFRKISTLMIVGILPLISLTGCGESHTYTGTLKETYSSDVKRDVKITFTKMSKDEATMTVKADGTNELERCLYPIKLKESSGSWSPNFCAYKSNLDIETSDGIIGYLDIKDKEMTGKFTVGDDISTQRKYEFAGVEK